MIERIIISGAGGQGILLLGKILAEAAMKENKFVTWLPSYGAEVRGGSAYCMVIVSDEEIGSPYVNQADNLIAMNEGSLKKFKPRLKNNGLMVINTSLISRGIANSLKAIKYPFTEIALKLGNIRVANMVALGCFLAQKKIVSLKNILDTIEEIAPPDKKYLVEINKQAVNTGAGLKNQKGK